MGAEARLPEDIGLRHSLASHMVRQGKDQRNR